MKKLLLFTLSAIAAICMSAAEKVDQIPGTLTLTAKYEQQTLIGESGAMWLVTLKDDGNGPQCKAPTSGIAVKESAGMARKVSVTWGKKSNEGVIVYGSHEPYTTTLEALEGTMLGTIAFTANTTASLDITGDWEYIGMTSTAELGKACQFVSIEVTWETSDVVEADPQEGIVINEVCGNDGTAGDGSEDWIELANASDKAIALNGLQISKIDDEGLEIILCTFGESDVMQPGDYRVCRRNTDFTDGIPHSKNMIVRLISANGNVIDRFDKRTELTDNGHHNAGGSYSRFPDMTGTWMAVENCTPGAANDGTPIQPEIKKFQRVTSIDQLISGMEFILVNEEHNFAMSASWATTKDGAVYQLAEPVTGAEGIIEVDVRRAAVCRLEATGTGAWGIQFGETNNYRNEDRYLACEVFKSLQFKKSIDKTGVAATITFNADGDAEISYDPLLGGSIKFNYKGDGTDRFLNYDPTDKPEDHLPVHIYKVYNGSGDGIETVTATPADDTEIYDLYGRRVDSAYRGIVIIAGKKVLK